MVFTGSPCGSSIFTVDLGAHTAVKISGFCDVTERTIKIRGKFGEGQAKSKPKTECTTEKQQRGHT